MAQGLQNQAPTGMGPFLANLPLSTFHILFILTFLQFPDTYDAVSSHIILGPIFPLPRMPPASPPGVSFPWLIPIHPLRFQLGLSHP